MQKILYLLICFPLLALAGEDQGVNFDAVATWPDLLAKAELQNKYIFIYRHWPETGPETPGQKMLKGTFLDKDLGRVMNEKFVSAVLDFSVQRNTERNAQWLRLDDELRKIYGNELSAYPGYLFFSPAGRWVYQDLGYKTPEEFIAMVKKVLDPTTHPEKPDGRLMKLYKREKAISLIKEQEFGKLWNGDKPASPNPDWNVIRHNFEQKCNAEIAERLIWEAKADFYMRTGNVQAFIESIDGQIERFPPRIAATLFDIESIGKLDASALWALDRTDDRVLLERILKWMDACAKLGGEKPDTGVLQVMARILHKLNRRDEAINALEKAIAIRTDLARKANNAAKRTVVDPVKSNAELTTMLEKIKKGEPTWKT